MQPFLHHLEHSTNPCLHQLVNIMHQKQSNLAIAADLLTTNEVVKLAEQCGPHICLLKIHVDILTDFSASTITQLQDLSKKHNFLLFEDRKFADIGNTVINQYTEGLYRINDWAHLTNAHILPGDGIVQAMKPHGLERGHALLLLAEMSSKDNHFTPEYVQANVKLALQHKDFVIGFICQNRLTNEPGLLHFTPGIHPEKSGDNYNQQYLTPEKALVANKTDILIVGRAVSQHQDPATAARDIKEKAWSIITQ